MAVKTDKRRGELAGRVLKMLERLVIQHQGQKKHGGGQPKIRLSLPMPVKLRPDNIHLELDVSLLGRLRDERLQDLIQNGLVRLDKDNGNQQVVSSLKLYNRHKTHSNYELVS